MNGYSWFPNWPSGVFGDQFSNALANLNPPLPLTDTTVTLDVISARESLTAYQLPTSANGYALSILFSDYNTAGGDWYEVEIKVNPPSSGPGLSDWSPAFDQPTAAQLSMNMAFDSGRQVTVMFGGRDSSFKPLSDTYEYALSAWKKVLTPHSPSARYWAGMAYDALRRRIVLFGGVNDSTTVPSFFNDTWEYDGSDWTSIQTVHTPPAQDGLSMAYDSCRQKVVMLADQRETWEYDGIDWTKVATSSAPPNRRLAALVFDSRRCRTVLFGGLPPGANPLTALSDTWEYDGASWTQINLRGSPSGRWAHAMVYDTNRARTVLFGGYGPIYPQGQQTNDTWEYDGTKWAQAFPQHSPGQRQQHGLAYDQIRQRVVMFGGFGGAVDGGAWEYKITTPQQSVTALITLLSSPSLGLVKAQINSLTDKLTNVLVSIQQGLYKQAINQLNAFVNSVQSSLKTGKISASTATALISAANAIISALGSGGPAPQKVLVTGGLTDPISGVWTDTAEVFHAATGTWIPTQNRVPNAPPADRSGLCAPNMALLGNDKVLVAGGGCSDAGVTTNAASLYDPATNSWTSAAPMAFGRDQFGMVSLSNGNALAFAGCAGGCSGPNILGQFFPTVGRSTETYSHQANSWTTLAPLNTGRGNFASSNLLQTVVRLLDDKVLACNGSNGINISFTTCEIYDPATNIWSTTGGLTEAGPHQLALLPSGHPLAIMNNGIGAIRFDPTAGIWFATGSLGTRQTMGTLAVLGNGEVLVSGGSDGVSPVNTAQIFNPTSGTWRPTGSMTTRRAGHIAVPLGDGRVLVAGGQTTGSALLSSAEIFDPATGTWSPTGSMSLPRAFANAVALPPN
jgi:N-acetylneuraminic acid mutarotase